MWRLLLFDVREDAEDADSTAIGSRGIAMILAVYSTEENIEFVNADYTVAPTASWAGRVSSKHERWAIGQA